MSRSLHFSAAPRVLAAAALLTMVVGCRKDEEVEPKPPTATIGTVLDGLPSCSPTDANGRVNLISGCVDGACVGQTFEEMVEAVRLEPDCVPIADDLPGTRCDFENVFVVDFVDTDYDVVPDKGYAATSIRLIDAAGGTQEGLGVGASSSCVIEEYGDPDLVTWTLIGSVYVMTEATWIGWGLTIIDDDGPPGELDPDGIIDEMIIEGAR